MTSTVLLTLGRLPKGLDIARSFRAAGWRVIVAEPFGWHLCALSRAVTRSVQVTAPNEDHTAYCDDVLRLVAEEDVRLIVPVSEETMHVAGLHDRLPAGVALFTGTQRDVLALHDKYAFAQSLSDYGLAAPRTALTGDEMAGALVSDGPLIVKDRFGAAGLNLLRLEQGEALPADRPGSLVQEALAGEEVSSFSVVHGGAVSATVVYRSIIRDGSVATVFERIERPEVERYVAAIAEASGHTGFLSFDMMVAGDGTVTAFECNPRANSGVHFLATEDIAPAILDPAFRPRFGPHRIMQQAYPTLTLLWGAIGSWARYRTIGKALLTARDVSWSWRDPLPFALMTPATWPLLRQALFEGRSLGEASIHDIGWFDQPTS